MYIFIYIHEYIDIEIIYIYIQRGRPKQPQDLASRTHGQTLQGTSVLVNMFPFQTYVTLLKPQFFREESLVDLVEAGLALSHGKCGNLEDSSMPTVSMRQGSRPSRKWRCFHQKKREGMLAVRGNSWPTKTISPEQCLSVHMQ